MPNNKKQFIIYKAVNSINGKVYIGATTCSLEERKKDHLRKADNCGGHYFQQAIATYKPEAFTWEQLDTALSIDELAAKEIKYIEKYHSFENGYNSDKGGGFKKTIYQYNLDGTLSNTYLNLASAAASIGVSTKTLSKACWNVNHSLGGYYWSAGLVSKFIPLADRRKKAVLQLDASHILLAKFLSVSDAANKLKLSKSGIAKCCRGERHSCGGFIWKYE